MRFILLIVIITFNFSLKSQNLRLDIVKDLAGINYVVLSDYGKKRILDTIVKYAYDVKIIDFLILDESSILYISEDDFSFFYQKFNKLNGQWKESNSSGVLSGNNKWVSFKDPKLDWRPKTFKILKEDLVSIRKGDTEIIKDCNQFKTEREAWLKQVEFDYEQYLKSKKN